MKQPGWFFLVLIAVIATACSNTSNDASQTASDEVVELVSEINSEQPDTLPFLEQDSSSSDEVTTITDPVDAEPQVDTEEPQVEEVEPQDDTEEPQVEEVDEPTDQPAEDPVIPSCEAPALAAHFIDVPLDDPDGGLNVRSAAGPQNETLATFARGKELISLGNCEVFASTDWWEVTNSDGSLTGWVSSSFLSDEPLLEVIDITPGLGAATTDTANAGISAETLDELAAQLASAYGFDDEVAITMVGEENIHDAVGGDVTYDLLGLRDDSTSGYRVEILFFFDKDEDAVEILGFTARRITRQPICTRGVSPEGICI